MRSKRRRGRSSVQCRFDEATIEKIREGLAADILITTGGVSVGDRDCVKESIIALGGQLLFWKVDMKPGKPFAFAMLEDKPVFALPGNPVAAMVGFEMFVRPAMLHMMGHSRIHRPRVRATLHEKSGTGVTGRIWSEDWYH